MYLRDSSILLLSLHLIVFLVLVVCSLSSTLHCSVAQEKHYIIKI